MAKTSKVLTSLILGAAGGAAAAVFLATETGKKFKNKAVTFVKDYQEHPDEVNADILQRAQDLKDQAVDKYNEVKGQFESGELTVDDLVQNGKEKATVLKDQSLEKFGQLKSKLADQKESTTKDMEEFVEDEVDLAEDIVVQDEIEINL
ncbi:YtxH domain-containing protein [Streptococcus sp. X16XC17]|uniref:YtxH domain-containing protein n=1 Tax=unclassified Streptococcus TaxID=2608887 RepID=UPI00066FCBBB|nr:MULTISPECIES: YtxH domain-containing protein [unclassified Streptococcus]TCD46168.1 YtxH domain-containing protein [Streptococcus sp. X16XC17]